MCPSIKMIDTITFVAVDVSFAAVAFAYGNSGRGVKAQCMHTPCCRRLVLHLLATYINRLTPPLSVLQTMGVMLFALEYTVLLLYCNVHTSVQTISPWQRLYTFRYQNRALTRCGGFHLLTKLRTRHALKERRKPNSAVGEDMLADNSIQ